MKADRVDVQRLLDLEDGLSDQAIGSFVDRIRNDYELAHIAYLCPSFPGCNLTDPFLAVTYPDTWVEHYRKEGYVAVDTALAAGMRSVVPVDWRTLPQTGEKKIKRLFREAVDAGIGRQGLTIPVRGPRNGTWAVFVATAEDNERDWDLRRYELVHDLVHIANYVHQKASDLHFGGQHTPDLGAITRREIEALQWSAEGKTTADIGILLAISTETARAHLDSVRYKLQALNRTHAVAKALRAGLIS